jgi:cation transport regulator ChaC
MRGDHLWYFAYGSNMSPATFLERRGMRPLETRRAFVDGYRLSFDIPVGPGERGVANLLVDAAARTHGVAYLVTIDEAEHLDRTEGVPHLYYRHAVEVRLDDRAPLPGFTYRSTVTAGGRKPSARYLDILLDGARRYDLPAEYIASLESLELAVDERTGAVRQ